MRELRIPELGWQALMMLLAPALLFSLAASTSEKEPVRVGRKMPAPEVREWLGKAPLEASSKFRATIWVFWGTFNEPLYPALPALKSFAQKQRGQVQVGVLSINEQGPDPASEVRAFAQKFALPNLKFAREVPGAWNTDRWLRQTQIDVTPAAFVVDQRGVLRFMGHVDESIAATEKLLRNQPLPESKALREGREGRAFGRIVREAEVYAKKADYQKAFAVLDRLPKNHIEGGTMWKVIWTGPTRPDLTDKILTDVRRTWKQDRWYFALGGLVSEDVAFSNRETYNKYRAAKAREFVSAVKQPDPLLLATAALVLLHAEEPTEGQRLLQLAEAGGKKWPAHSQRKKELVQTIDSFRDYGN